MRVQGFGRTTIRVYLLDDHDIVRRGLRDLLAAKHDITVVGDSGDSRDAVERIVRAEPDVLVADLRLQEGSGARVCRDVRALAPAVRSLLLTSAGEDEALAACVLCGALGYQTKLANSTEILENVRRVGAGRALVDPFALERARERLLHQNGHDPQEQEVLTRVLDGLTDDQIAADLGEDPDRVRAVVDSIIVRATAE